MDETVRCSQCGYRNDARLRHCQLCSSLIGDGRPSAAPRAPGPPPARHFLIPVVGERVEIVSGVTCTLGRDPECQIRCRTKKVSRRHALVSLQGNPARPVLEDLGSRNGTRVNGAPVPPKGTRALADGDEIEVGGVSFTYRLVAAGAGDEVLHPDSHEITVASALDQEDSAISGCAGIIPLATVVSRLQELHASGCLRVESGPRAGALYFLEGRSLGGRFGGHDGAAALEAVIALQGGKFRFEPIAATETPPPAPRASAAPAARPWFEKSAPER